MSEQELPTSDDLMDDFLCRAIRKESKDIFPRDLLRVLANAGGGAIKVMKFKEYTVARIEVREFRMEAIISDNVIVEPMPYEYMTH